jgi:hypothetical protein
MDPRFSTLHTSVDFHRCVEYAILYERKRIPALARQAGMHLRNPPWWERSSDCPFKDKVSQLPMHGGGKELGTRLVEKIKKDLGLK